MKCRRPEHKLIFRKTDTCGGFDIVAGGDPFAPAFGKECFKVILEDRNLVSNDDRREVFFSSTEVLQHRPICFRMAIPFLIDLIL